VSCWELDGTERAQVAASGRVWVASQTFRSLDEPPSGERWQPWLFVAGTHDSAFSVTASDSSSSGAPASDRIVRFSDNQSEAEQLGQAFSELTRKLRFGNELGDFSREEADQAASELAVLNEALERGSARAEWFKRSALSTLRWIADKSCGAVISELAKAAFHLVVALFR
jgi:hypothetical protein